MKSNKEIIQVIAEAIERMPAYYNKPHDRATRIVVALKESGFRFVHIPNRTPKTLVQLASENRL